jgi:hypothetical protein
MGEEEPLDPLVEAFAEIEKREKEDRAWKTKKDAVRPELVRFFAKSPSKSEMHVRTFDPVSSILPPPSCC